jgi:hypothetical protein
VVNLMSIAVLVLFGIYKSWYSFGFYAPYVLFWTFGVTTISFKHAMAHRHGKN